MGGGRRSKREGLCVYTWLIHFIVQQKSTQHCEVIIPNLKKRSISSNRASRLLGSLRLEGSEDTASVLGSSCLLWAELCLDSYIEAQRVLQNIFRWDL